MGTASSILSSSNNEINAIHRYINTIISSTDGDCSTDSIPSLETLMDNPLLSIQLLRSLSVHGSVDDDDDGGGDISTRIGQWITIEYLELEVAANTPKEKYLLDWQGSIASLPLSLPISVLGLSAQDSITDSSFKNINLQHIQFLNLASNQIQSLSTLAMTLPHTLLAIDLSFNESIHFTHLCFYPLLNLRSLILDGCGITTTMVDTTGEQHIDADKVNNDEGDDVESKYHVIGYFDSIFSGLINLKELSLKENQLTASSLLGLFYFSLESVDSQLASLWVDDNPLCDSQKLLRTCCEALLKRIPSLVSINDKKYPRSSSNVDVVAILRNGGHRIDTASNAGNEKALANLETEYLSALKGDRESTIVS